MSAEKKTHPTVAAVERVETGAGLDRSTTSTSKHTTSDQPGQAFRVADLLLHGRENAQPLKHLKGLLHTDGRTVRLAIRAERLSGIPICEDSRSGYYLPSNAQEKDLCAKRLRHRAAEVIKVADAIAAADIEGASDPD